MRFLQWIFRFFVLIACMFSIVDSRPTRRKKKLSKQECLEKKGFWLPPFLNNMDKLGLRYEHAPERKEYTYYDKNGAIFLRIRLSRNCYMPKEQCKATYDDADKMICIAPGQIHSSVSTKPPANANEDHQLRFQECPKQCPGGGGGGEAEKRKAAVEVTPQKKMRADSGGTAGNVEITGGTSGEASGTLQEPEEDTDRVRRATESKDCFMKYAGRNPHPGECNVNKNEPLIPLLDLVPNSAADYSDIPVDNEADLVLSRGDGLFHWSDLPLDKLHICHKHYHDLGMAWKHNQPKKYKKRTEIGLRCNVPAIEGANSHISPVVAKKYTFVTKEESEALWHIKKTFVPIGTGKTTDMT